jgi:hypothetical protein
LLQLLKLLALLLLLLLNSVSRDWPVLLMYLLNLGCWLLLLLQRQGLLLLLLLLLLLEDLILFLDGFGFWSFIRG